MSCLKEKKKNKKYYKLFKKGNKELCNFKKF